MGIFSKSLFLLVGSHFELLLKLSVPPFTPKLWDKSQAMLFPLLGGFLTMMQFRIINIDSWKVALIVALISTIILYCITDAINPPSFLIVIYQIRYRFLLLLDFCNQSNGCGFSVI